MIEYSILWDWWKSLVLQFEEWGFWIELHPCLLLIDPWDYWGAINLSLLYKWAFLTPFLSFIPPSYSFPPFLHISSRTWQLSSIWFCFSLISQEEDLLVSRLQLKPSHPLWQAYHLRKAVYLVDLWSTCDNWGLLCRRECFWDIRLKESSFYKEIVSKFRDQAQWVRCWRDQEMLMIFPMLLFLDKFLFFATYYWSSWERWAKKVPAVNLNLFALWDCWRGRECKGGEGSWVLLFWWCDYVRDWGCEVEGEHLDVKFGGWRCYWGKEYWEVWICADCRCFKIHSIAGAVINWVTQSEKMKSCCSGRF